jgi:sulfite exporter TauE/SafE
MKKYTFYVSGTSCNSCKLFIEETLNALPGLGHSVVDIHTGMVILESSELDKQLLLRKINKSMEGKRYVFSLNKTLNTKNKSSDIWIALVIGVLFLVLFFALQKSGLLNFGIGKGATPVTSFLIGIVASLSSCLAIVGGLVLSLSAKVAKDDSNNKRPLVMFHLGRVFGFAILGGVLGLVGEMVGINYVFSGILGIIASLVMISLGINLIGIFRNNLVTLPSFIFSFFRKIEHETYTPLLIGLGTFFLPCGFTQSMQFVALSSSSTIEGAKIMFFFALGTFPVLAFLSFSSVSFAQSKYASVFFKSVGVVVVGFGIFALISQLVVLGFINPLFTL